MEQASPAQPVAPVATAQQIAASPVNEFAQTPEPVGAPVAVPVPDTTEGQPTQPNPFEAQIKELESQLAALKEAKQKDEDFITQARSLLDEENQKRQAAQFDQELTREAGQLKRKLDKADTDEEANGILFEHIKGIVQQVSGAYQQQMVQYRQQVEEWARGVTRPTYVEELIRQHNLPADFKQHLLAIQDDNSRAVVAAQFRALLDQQQSQQQQSANAQQADAIRQSGAWATGGANGSANVPREPIKAGTVGELAPMLQDFFFGRPRS